MVNLHRSFLSLEESILDFLYGAYKSTVYDFGIPYEKIHHGYSFLDGLSNNIRSKIYVLENPDAFNQLYSQFFSIPKKERSFFSRRIRSVHDLIKKFNGFTFRPGDASMIRDDWIKYKYNDFWPNNPFIVAEEMFFYSSSARDLDDLTIAALSSIDVHRAALGAAGTFPGIKVPDNYSHYESWNPAFMYAFAAAKGLVPDEYFEIHKRRIPSDDNYSEIFSYNKWIFHFLKDIRYKIELNLRDVFPKDPRRDISARTKDFNDFIELYELVISEAGQASKELHKAFCKDFYYSHSLDVIKYAEFKRRKKLRLF